MDQPFYVVGSVISAAITGGYAFSIINEQYLTDPGNADLHQLTLNFLLNEKLAVVVSPPFPSPSPYPVTIVPKKNMTIVLPW